MTAQTFLDSREIALPDAASTEALGARLGALLGAGDVVCLTGGLGAGKTTLARGAIRAWTGVEEEAPSPTYTLMQSYEGPKGELWHCDLYRLKQPDEALEAGVVEACETGPCLIEWPERMGAWLPRERLDVQLDFAGDGRRAALHAHGKWRGKLDAI